MATRNLVAMLVAVTASTTHADTVVLEPIDAQADTADGAAWTIDPGTVTLITSRFSGTPLESRAVLEFPLTEVPWGSTVVSATLEIGISLFTQPPDPVIEFHGYAGNGVLEVADATAPFNLIGESPPITGLVTYQIGLDPTYVESLLGSASHLGVRTYQQISGLAAGFWSVEGFGIEPTLTVEFESGADCAADINGSGDVGFDDLVSLLSMWGPCPGCPQDIDGDGIAGFSDLLTLLSTWGPCP